MGMISYVCFTSGLHSWWRILLFSLLLFSWCANKLTCPSLCTFFPTKMQRQRATSKRTTHFIKVASCTMRRMSDIKSEDSTMQGISYATGTGAGLTTFTGNMHFCLCYKSASSCASWYFLGHAQVFIWPSLSAITMSKSCTTFVLCA